MMGAKLGIAALCCLASYSVAAEEVESDASSKRLLYDDMRLYYDVMQSVDADQIKNVIDVNYKHVKMESVTAEETLSALKELKDTITKYDVPFKTSQLGERNSEEYSKKPIVETFKSLIDSVTSMKKKVEELREKVKPLVSFVEQSQKLYAEFETYYKENIYADTSSVDVGKLKTFCHELLKTDSKLVLLAKTFETYTKKMKETNTDFINPTTIKETPPTLPTADSSKHRQASETLSVVQSDSPTEQPLAQHPGPEDVKEPTQTSAHDGETHTGTCPETTGEHGAVPSETEASASELPNDSTTSSQENQDSDAEKIDEPAPEPESSVPGSSSASSTSPAAPQPVDTTSGPQGQAGSPQAPSEGVSGNLKGQNDTASSATFTGLSVATLCYIVLSAF
uniref:Merozoite surface antigen 1 n=1 Tax=Babesia orientalis TaxID=273649 RepID=A0A7S8BTI4_9APIC|nr:Merozoite surface antigen 1 [Babesia orientalis]